MKLVQKSWIYACRHASAALEFAQAGTPNSTRIEGRGGERHLVGGRIPEAEIRQASVRPTCRLKTAPREQQGEPT